VRQLLAKVGSSSADGQVSIMPMNRVQFQPSLSLPEFVRRNGSQAACEHALRDARWPTGFVCPRCQGTVASQFRRFDQPGKARTPMKARDTHLAKRTQAIELNGTVAL